MGFIARIGQAFSGLTNPSSLTVPVTTATVGNGTLLVAIGFGVTTVVTTVASVTDTQGNTYVLDAQANPGPFRCAELWRCTSFAPLSVYDPATGTGDQITITLTGTENRGIAGIIDQFTALNPPDQVTTYSTTSIQGGFKLAGTVSAADATGGISYSVIMPDFTVSWINQPAGFTPTGPALLPVAGSSLQAAYNPAPAAGPVTADWSWGPNQHSFGVILASYSPAPVLQDTAACLDTITVSPTQLLGVAPSAIISPQMSFWAVSSSTFAQAISNFFGPINPATVYSWGAWVWQSFAADFPMFMQINWYDASFTFLGATTSSALNSLTPALLTVSGSATAAGHPTAAYALADIFVFGGAGLYPSPTHTYYAAAAQQTTANWIYVPGNTVWTGNNANVSTLAPWVAAYGPQIEYGACLDGFSVVQELIV